jgi:hypothetical protein
LLVAGWFPPALAADQEPFDGPILPISSRCAPTLADCYLALALVHDAERRGPGKINPFEKKETAAKCCYHAQMSMVPTLSESDRLALDDCLARVEADLKALSPAGGPKNRSGGRATHVAEQSVVPPSRPPNQTEKRILTHCRRKAHKGERIANRLGLSYDHVRGVCARLVKHGHLKKTANGYRTV